MLNAHLNNQYLNIHIFEADSSVKHRATAFERNVFFCEWKYE